MEKELEFYADCTKALLRNYEALKTEWSTVELLFDDQRRRYMAIRVGWFKQKRIHLCLVHIDIADDSVVIQCNNTEDMVATELIEMGIASLLQNIGYALIPPGILEKSGPLNEIELQIVQKHPIYAQEILNRYVDIEPSITDIVLQHHERWNGEGYPNQLKQDEISKPAQIIGITDTCFALASKRPHREEFLPAFAIEQSIVSPKDAIEFIFAYSGELFNPELVRTFTSQIPVYPKGVKIKLNNGKEGVVCKANSGVLRRPQLRIYNKKSKYKLPSLPVENNGGDKIKAAVETSKNWRDLDLSKGNQKRVFVVDTFDY